MLKLTPFPTIVQYSDEIEEGTGGYAKMCYVRIRPKYKDRDIGIHRHEYLHVTQYYVVLLAWVLVCTAGMLLITSPYWVLGFALMPFGLALHPALYTLIPAYRFKCEVAAYQEQAKHYPNDRRPLFAKFIAEDYGLKISAADALKLLMEE